MVNRSRKFSRVQVRWIWPVKSSWVHSDVTSNAASAPRYATPSHSIGGVSSRPVVTPLRRARRETLGVPRRGAFVSVNGSTLDLGPGRGPVAVVGALHVGASVQALGVGRGRVP